MSGDENSPSRDSDARSSVSPDRSPSKFSSRSESKDANMVDANSDEETEKAMPPRFLKGKVLQKSIDQLNDKKVHRHAPVPNPS